MANNMMKADNINELYQNAISVIDTKGKKSSPRGMEIKELIGQQLILSNPLNCLVTIKDRKMNYKFAAIEKLEYLWGKHDADRLVAYNKNIRNYLGHYGYFDGNYAQRFNYWLDHIFGLLKSDPDTRQAVISIYDGSARHQSSDIPCTLTLQFLLREDHLNLIVSMRSNDLLWGFPYDVNAFCFIQEVMACWLGVKLGYYIHQAGSLHLYMNEHYDTLMKTQQGLEYHSDVNPKWDLNYEDTKKYLPIFFAAEQAIRTGDIAIANSLADSLPKCLAQYYAIISTKWTSTSTTK